MSAARTTTLWNLIPAVAWLTLFFILPMLIMAAISVFKSGEPIAWTVDGSAYARLFDDVHAIIIVRSIVYAAITTLICLMIGYPVAYYIARSKPLVRRWLFFLVLVPLWANSLILIYSWIILLRPDGLFELVLRGIGLSSDDDPISLLYTPFAVIIGLTYWYLPFMIYPLYASIEKFDFQLIDAATNLGATPLQSFRRVMLPITLPGIWVGCGLVFIESMSSFIIPDLLGGAKTMMLGNLIQQRFLSFPQDWPFGAALTFSVVALMIVGYFVGNLRRRARHT